MLNLLSVVATSVSCGFLLYFAEKHNFLVSLVYRLENRVDDLEEQIRDLESCIVSLSPTPPTTHDDFSAEEKRLKADLLYNLSPITATAAAATNNRF